MINYRVKVAEARNCVMPKQVAADLNMTLNTYSQTVGGFRCNPGRVEKIARYLNLKPKQVNKNYNKR